MKQVVVLGAGFGGATLAAEVDLPAKADLLTPEGSRVTLKPPSEEGLEGKRQFERERFAKWFGG
ncbi:MAG TPA: hypothetical protein VM182_13645 [Terriglobia bacterium]|nr:hypothetical protein [Terriglobia bacterium]